jgi:hypothetical protein
VLAITALLMLPLMAFTGFAVDLGSWAGTASRAQAAADAAALAGVVYLPDLPARAVSVARETAAKNGYTNGVDGVTVTATPNSRNELDVMIFDPNVGQYFSSVFTDPPDITRSATAEFIRPVAMGSPSAHLGQDPELTVDPAFVLNTAGPGSTKVNGDKRAARDCNGAAAGCGGGVNSDYSPDGYLYAVEVDTATSASGQPLKIEVFDPAYVYNGDSCESANNDTFTAAQISNLSTRYSDARAAQRYARGRTLYCMGDQSLPNNSTVTTYIVRAPDDTPSDLSDNPAICAITFDPYNPGSRDNMYNLLNNSTLRGRENQIFGNHYRKWFPVCTVPSGQVQTGTYVLQIRTNADLSAPPTMGPGLSAANINAGLTSAGSLQSASTSLNSTSGYNRYTLRAGRGSNLTNDFATAFSGVSVSGVGHLPIYMNRISPSAEFYLARIVPEAAGKTLQLIFWDMADLSGTGVSATFTLIPPADASGTPFQCSFSRDGTTPPPGAVISGCSASNITNANYNGRNMIVRIPIPGNYSCDVEDPNGCWTKVRVQVVGSGASAADTTTWSASMTGDPIRLIR